MPLDTLRTFKTGSDPDGKFYSLPELEKQGIRPGIAACRSRIRIVLESLLRNCDGKKVTEGDVQNLANWNAKAPGDYEIPFVVARIVLQDFTGVPLLVDLAAMRSAVACAGQGPEDDRAARAGGSRRRSLGAGGFRGHGRRAGRRISISSSTATASATSSSSGASRRSTPSRSCRPASASCTR